MANVYLAAAGSVPGVHKLAVVKCLRASFADDAGAVAMFLDEARLAVRLQHPNVIQTFGAGEHDGTYFIAMEYLEGQPLNKIARLQAAAHEPLSEALSLYIVSEVLAGLDYAHKLTDYDGRPLGIVHRDISPHNIFLTYLGHVRILDFGIAKAALNTTKTEEGVFKGKAHYMSPEQVLSEKSIDRRADVFSAGVVLWELLTGRRLMHGDVASVLGAIVAAPIPRVSSIAPRVDEHLDALVARALEKEPDARYQTAGEMREDIQDYLRATGAVVGQRDVEALLLALCSGERETRSAEVREAMQDLDGMADGSDLELLRPLHTAALSGSIRRKGDGFTPSGITATASSLSARRSRPDRRDVAADLAELASPDAMAGARDERAAGPWRNWLIVVVVVAAIAALIGWLR
jgi:serine/threonine-protein kinase